MITYINLRAKLWQLQIGKFPGKRQLKRRLYSYWCSWLSISEKTRSFALILYFDVSRKLQKYRDFEACRG
jgi:hypothetical protein